MTVNLFSAIIVHAYFNAGEKHESLKTVGATVELQRALFDRLDKEHRGEIPVEQLGNIALLLGLEGLNVDDVEIQTEIKDIDMDGNDTVDFQEFSIWWSSNSPLVMKPSWSKQAIRYTKSQMSCTDVCVLRLASFSIISLLCEKTFCHKTVCHDLCLSCLFDTQGT